MLLLVTSLLPDSKMSRLVCPVLIACLLLVSTLALAGASPDPSPATALPEPRALAGVLYDRVPDACAEKLQNFTTSTLAAMHRIVERGSPGGTLVYALSDLRCGLRHEEDTFGKFVAALCGPPNHFHVQCDPAKIEAPAEGAGASAEKSFLVHVHARPDSDTRPCECAVAPPATAPAPAPASRDIL